MGFVLSVLYFVTSYLTPTTLFGAFAVYRIELILAVLVLLVSLPRVMKSCVLKTPQSLALIGLALAVFLSVLVTAHWPGGAVRASLGFIPNAFAYFLVCLHCNSKKRLQGVVLMLLFVCLFVIAHGSFDLLHGVPDSGSLLSEESKSVDQNQWEREHPYLFAQTNDAGKQIYRLRGLGVIHDPNDFGQLIACEIPLMFIFWRPKKKLRNFILVALPVCILLLGAYLTHSRGALVALMMVAIVASRRRIGTIPALLVVGGAFVAAMSLHFTGGRGISLDAGSDRTALWGESLQVVKSHPLFGVGFGNLADYLGHTAHNSIAVCAAELGLFGLYFWCLFLFSTVRDVLVIASPVKVSEGEPIITEEKYFPQPINARKLEAIDKAEVNHLGRLLVLSFTGFLVAGCFLSRAFVMTLFLLGGMVEVVFEMALQRGMIAPRLRLPRVFFYAALLAVVSILLLYILLRAVNLLH
jgi:hypothetical protein